MTLALELLGAFVAGVVALPVAGVVWWRWLGGKRKLLQRMLGPLFPPQTTTTGNTGGAQVIANTSVGGASLGGGGSNDPNPPRP